MVLKRGNVAIGEDALAAEKAVSNLHKMQWLKHQNNPERRDCKDDEMTNLRNGNKQSRKSRGRNTKPANGQKNHGRYFAPQHQGNAWVDGNGTAAALFVGTEPATPLSHEMEEELDEEMKQAIAESIKSMAEHMTITEANKDAEKVEERTDDNEYWSKPQKNLPSPVSQELQKTSDTNNNSSAGKSSVSTFATKVPDRRADHSLTRPQSSHDAEKEAIDKVSNELLCTPPENTHFVDQFDRIDGQNERHMFMGRGGRKKEQLYLKQQQRELEHQQHRLQQQATPRPSNETPTPQQETNRHDSNRTNQQYSGRGPRISQTPSRRPPSDVPGSRSFPSDKFHYVRDESRPHPEHAERQTSGDRQKCDLPEEVPVRGPSTVEVLAKEIESPARASLPVDGKPRTTEVSSSSQIEKNGESSVNSADRDLRLRGFNSRFNTPVNDEFLDSPKVQTEIATASSACVEPRKNLSTEVENASWKAETPRCSQRAPPGFSCPQLRPADNYLPNYEPEASNLYERLATHDPSLYRFLMQRENGICRQGQAAACAKDNFTVQEDYWRRDGGEESPSFATQETTVSDYQKEESSNEYAIEAHSATYVTQFVPDDRQFLDDSRPDSNFLYANEEAPVGYDSFNYSPIATDHPDGCIYVPHPHSHYHGRVVFQPPLENWMIPQLQGNEHLGPPETPRLQPRCTIPQYCAAPPTAIWYHEGYQNPEPWYPEPPIPQLKRHYGPRIRSQPGFTESTRLSNNGVPNFPVNRGYCRPHSTGSRGIPPHLPRGARRSHVPQQRYPPDTGHGRGRV